MTYAERIEAIARAMVRHDVSETMAGRADLEAAFGKRWAEESEAYENLARAADRACLKAIECHGEGFGEKWSEEWRAMHAAIPRGE